MKATVSLFLVTVLVFASACEKARPRTPAPFTEHVINHRLKNLETLADAYDKDIAAKDLTAARITRNQLIYQSLQLIDASYNDFENNLFVGRASQNVLADFTELAVAAVTGITNGERVKSILAISLTGFKGLRKSIDVNFFRERTTEVLALKMRAARAKTLQVIQQGLALSVEQYPLEAGLEDLTNYIYAGSLNSALLELSQDTGAEAKQARERVAKLKITPFLTKSERDEFDLIVAARDDFITKLGNDASKAQATADLKAAVTQLYDANQATGKTPDELLDMLQAKIEEARDKSDEALRKKILKALKITQ